MPQARDCKLVVSWTGNADIDLTVQEPTGAVCSFRNPRTTGGGVLEDDPLLEFQIDRQRFVERVFANLHSAPRI